MTNVRAGACVVLGVAKIGTGSRALEILKSARNEDHSAVKEDLLQQSRGMILLTSSAHR